MKLGKKSTLITAYASLFTIAGGLVAYDAHSRRAPQSKAVAVSEAKANPGVTLATVKARPLSEKKLALK
jgi:hypothetical protein